MHAGMRIIRSIAEASRVLHPSSDRRTSTTLAVAGACGVTIPIDEHGNETTFSTARGS
jgi:hypothetical protein